VLFYEEYLKRLGVRRIVIKHPPDRYWSSLSAIRNSVFSSCDYKIVRSETASVFEITANGPEYHMHHSEKKRLRKAREAGFVFQGAAIADAKTVYTFIRKCREEKNYAISMSWEHLQRTVTRFPDRYYFFKVHHEGNLAAASIAIRVHNNILYDFYHDHTKTYDNFSPVVLLVDGIYRYCLENGIRLLDLGTSSLEDGENTKLLTFKARLGAQPSARLTVEKIFHE
jgi:hypothetical protein